MGSHAAAILSAFSAAARIAALAKARHLVLRPLNTAVSVRESFRNSICDTIMWKKGPKIAVVQGDNSGLVSELVGRGCEAGVSPGSGLMGGLLQLLRTGLNKHQRAERLPRAVSSFCLILHGDCI